MSSNTYSDKSCKRLIYTKVYGIIDTTPKSVRVVTVFSYPCRVITSLIQVRKQPFVWVSPSDSLSCPI